MRNSIIFILAIILCTSCSKDAIRVSNETVTTAYNFTNINAIDIAGDIAVTVDLSSTDHGVSTTFNSELQDIITVENIAGTLKVYYNQPVSIRGNVRNTIYLTTTMIQKVVATGEVQVSVLNEVTSDEFDVTLTGESSLSGALQVQDLHVNLAGEGSIDIYGSATRVEMGMAGESNVAAYDLLIDNLKINIAGESKANVHVTEEIDISAAGESEFRYKGEATFANKSTAGEARIIKVG